jgi:glutathione peroxidase
MNIYDIKLTDIYGKEVQLQDFQDKVLLIVNTASQCGFTPQYRGLEELYEKYKDRGLVIMGFPCNQFGGQEPGTHEEIQDFCETNYSIKFPMFEKVDVNGKKTHPLYQYLKAKAPGLLGSKNIKWNFTKFLISKNANQVTRYAPTTSPESLDSDIQKLLG